LDGERLGGEAIGKVVGRGGFWLGRWLDHFFAKKVNDACFGTKCA